jgi:hypothetical protein
MKVRIYSGDRVEDCTVSRFVDMTLKNRNRKSLHLYKR